MSILSCYVSDEDTERLNAISRELGRKPEELAEAAISESINNYFRTRPIYDKDRRAPG